MSQLIEEAEIARPTPDPVTSSVLAHATVAEIGRFGLRNNEGLWPSYNCIDTLVPTPICPDPMLTETGEWKSYDFPEWVPAFEFAVQGGVQCKVIGLDRADMEAEVRRVFALNEGKGVERALAANRFVASTSGETPLWGDPVDLTPGSAISLATALALLEGYAAANYAGLPTIHMPRAAASLLNERIVWKGDEAYTRSGSKIAIGGGYDPDYATGFDGTWDLFATGEVYVERSGTIDINTMVLPGDGSGTGSDQNGLSDNTALALVERMYRVGVDCFVAKVTGTATTLDGGAGFGV
jgi:hypothetical protein